MCPISLREAPAAATAGRSDACHAGTMTPSSAGDPDNEPPAVDGAFFGRYVLGPRLGRGAMGVVYKVHDPEVGRDVALKMLHGGQNATTLALSLFQEEIRVFARLDHPHVVPIYEAGEHAHQLYFTMKLLPGDLKSQIGRFAGDPVGAATLVEKIALAVRHLHQRGILHRDLKPANILLDAEEPPNPYVADFGVAKRIGEDGQLLRTSVVVGTPAYMAPEQAAGKEVTWATDVYSLGVILYEMLTQRLPFEGYTQEVAQAKQTPPKNPSALDPRIDRDLARICLRCVAKDPEHRYPSAAALATALQRYLSGEPYEGASLARRAWRWCLCHSVLTGLLVSILMLLALTVVVVGEQQAAKTAQIREANKKSAAAFVAGSMAAQDGWLSDVVACAASDERLAIALTETAPGPTQQRNIRAFCEKTYTPVDDPIHDLNVAPETPYLIIRHPAFEAAGFAPVGGTGFVVNLQPWWEEEALKTELALARQMAIWTACVALPGALFVIFAGVYNGWLRRRRSRRRSQAAP